MNLPNQDQIRELQIYYRVPPNILEHTATVKETVLYLARELNKVGGDYDLELLAAAADLHDIGKAVTLEKLPLERVQELGLPVLADEDYEFWAEERKKFPSSYRHADIAAEIMKDYPEVAEVVGNHTPRHILNEGLSKGAILLNYADKISATKVITLEERFAYFVDRYRNEENEESKRIFARYKEIEADIFNRLGFPAEELGERMKNGQ
jgi:putative nucleotidyltransferase with HDIG domain